MSLPPKIKLEDTRIRSLNFGAKGVGMEEEVVLNFQLSSGYLYDYTKKQIIVRMSVSVDQEGMPFLIDVEYEGLFRLNKRMAKKRVEPFAKTNCPAILFPFVRECIADITRRAGFQPLILPSINFVELARKGKETERKKSSKSASS